jgi:soluble cytochrome b562
MYAEDSIDDARSMVESLQGMDDATGNIENDELLQQTRALLAELKNDESNRDEAAEEAKKNEFREKMAKLGTMIDKADEMR